jgi:hypothetical protein
MLRAGPQPRLPAVAISSRDRLLAVAISSRDSWARDPSPACPLSRVPRVVRPPAPFASRMLRAGFSPCSAQERLRAVSDRRPQPRLPAVAISSRDRLLAVASSSRDSCGPSPADAGPPTRSIRSANAARRVLPCSAQERLRAVSDRRPQPRLLTVAISSRWLVRPCGPSPADTGPPPVRPLPPRPVISSRPAGGNVDPDGLGR